MVQVCASWSGLLDRRFPELPIMAVESRFSLWSHIAEEEKVIASFPVQTFQGKRHHARGVGRRGKVRGQHTSTGHVLSLGTNVAQAERIERPPLRLARRPVSRPGEGRKKKSCEAQRAATKGTEVAPLRAGKNGASGRLSRGLGEVGGNERRWS